MNWDDLRYVLALHRAGTLTGAAKSLGVNHATVSRRVNALEGDLGISLFTKAQDGWELTEAGVALFQPIEAVERAALELERVARGTDPAVGGIVRIAASQLLSGLVAAPMAKDLREEWPEIQIDVWEGVNFVSLPRQEADIALRMSTKGVFPGSPSVVMTRLCGLEWAMCASQEIIDQYEIEAPIDHPGDLPVIKYNEHAPASPDRTWIERTPGDPNVVFSTNSMYGVHHAVRNGVGLGLLPHAYATDGVMVVSGVLFEMDVWLAVHPDVAESERIRIVTDFIKDWVASRPGLFDAK